MSVLKRNTTSRLRNVYISGPSITLATTYSKSRPLTMKEKVSFRSSDSETAKLLVVFEAFCSRMVEYCLKQTDVHFLDQEEFQYEEPQTDYRYLQFHLSRKKISSEQLSTIIRNFFLRYTKKAHNMDITKLRHVAIAMQGGLHSATNI